MEKALSVPPITSGSLFKLKTNASFFLVLQVSPLSHCPRCLSRGVQDNW